TARISRIGPRLSANLAEFVTPARVAATQDRHLHSWNAISAASIMPLPAACSGVMISPRISALRIMAMSGSRFMISAVRNGPMRTAETKMTRMLTVVATLIATRAAQPTLVCGGFQVRAPSDTATKISAWATTEYQVVSRASSPEEGARDEEHAG